MTSDDPVNLYDVKDVADLSASVVSQFARDIAKLLPEAEIHHIGATSLPFGHTTGDVDVNLRVAGSMFPAAVRLLEQSYTIAQRENWTDCFASYSSDAYALPLGIQVTLIGSPDDFLLALRDRMRSDAELLSQYDNCKLAAAPHGSIVYWQAKNEFLRSMLDYP
jgi:GrpB-like predicted nucleotidyltransferase (UPF0157 family)